MGNIDAHPRANDGGCSRRCVHIHPASTKIDVDATNIQSKADEWILTHAVVDFKGGRCEGVEVDGGSAIEIQGCRGIAMRQQIILRAYLLAICDFRIEAILRFKDLNGALDLVDSHCRGGKILAATARDQEEYRGDEKTNKVVKRNSVFSFQSKNL